MDQASGNRTALVEVAATALSFAPEKNVDPDIARFESMPIDEVNEALRKHGIDPDETIKAVIALVNQKLHPRRVVHPEKVSGFAAVRLAALEAVRLFILAIARPWQLGRAAPVLVLS